MDNRVYAFSSGGEGKINVGEGVKYFKTGHIQSAK